MDLNSQRDGWQSFIKNSTHNGIAQNLHASWDLATQSYTSHQEIDQEIFSFLKNINATDKVLDFGVGFGRNQSYLQKLFKVVHGYDLPEMVARTPVKNLLFDDLNKLSDKYDLLYEVTVMQHIPPNEVIYCLLKLAPRCKYFFTHTRSYNDFCRNFDKQIGGVNMYNLIAATNAWVPVIQTVSNPQNLNDESHYSVLYKSKYFANEIIL